MPRPTPTRSARQLASDLMIVRPYARSIALTGIVAAATIVMVLALVSNIVIVGIALAAIVLLAAQVIGYLLILAKQVEFVYRMNSRLDELLESTGLNEYVAGQNQGRADTLRELADKHIETQQSDLSR